MVPLGAAMGWDGRLLALQAAGDVAVALGFALAAATLIRLIVRRPSGLKDQSTLLSMVFAALVAGALLHAVELGAIWRPVYGLLVVAKLAFAVAAIVAAVMVWLMAPRILALPARAELEEANRRLAEEGEKRHALVAELREVNAALENRVAERTRELNEAKERFEMALAGSKIAVATQGPDLRYRWIHNPPLPLSPAEIVGRTEEDLVPPEVAHTLSATKSGVLRTGQPAVCEIELADAIGGRRWLRVHVTPLREADGAVGGVVSVGVDITEERRRAEMLEHVTQALAEANARFDTALGGSNITMYRQDRDLRYTWIHNAPAGVDAEEFLGRDDDAVLPETTARMVVPVKRRVVESGEADRLEFSHRIGDAVHWFDLRVEPLFENGTVAGVTCVAIDITEQKEHQQQLKVVMRELTHRSKNLLAVVQGIARQTAQTVEDLPAFVDRFGARLQALARAHDILVDESWRGASLDELVNSQLGHVIEKADDRLDEGGSRVMLKPEAAQNVALALHELATNAAKYGALSTPGGRVAVRWRLTEPGEVEAPARAGSTGTTEDRRIFEITWSEQGGPPVEEPKRKGFGRMMIERLVPRAIDGTSELVFDRDGIRWTLRFPTDYLAEGEDRRGQPGG